MILLLWIASYGVGWNVRFLLGSRTEIHVYRDRVLVSVAGSNGELAKVFLWDGVVHLAFARRAAYDEHPIKCFSAEWRGYGCWCSQPIVTATHGYVDANGRWIDRLDNTAYVVRWFVVRVPLWFLAAVFGAYPTWQLALWGRKIRRRRRGLCVYCGYDLRGLVEPRCPECGMAFDRTPLDQRATAGR
jgi:hypothetical protein